MIFSDRQLTVSQAELGKLRKAADIVRADTAKHPRLREIEMNALASQIADISLFSTIRIFPILSFCFSTYLNP